MEGSETGGARVGTGLRWRGARRELARENGGQRDGRPEASQASLQNVQNARGRHGCVEHMVAPQASVAPLGQCASRTKHGWG